MDNVANLWVPIILNGTDIVLAYGRMFTYLHPNTHKVNKKYNLFLHEENDAILIISPIFMIYV